MLAHVTLLGSAFSYHNPAILLLTLALASAFNGKAPVLYCDTFEHVNSYVLLSKLAFINDLHQFLPHDIILRASCFLSFWQLVCVVMNAVLDGVPLHKCICTSLYTT
jgi:hypothetical protein